MLEKQALWLGPWPTAGPLPPGLPVTPDPPLWVLRAPEDRSFLGLVRRRVQTLAIWFGGLTRPVVDVYETEDESLVLSFTRSWGFGARWAVRDADGQTMGTFSAYPNGCVAWDSLGLLLASFENGAEEPLGRWLSPRQTELGSVVRADVGVLVRFEPELEAKPWHKMVLLAMVLREECR